MSPMVTRSRDRGNKAKLSKVRDIDRNDQSERRSTSKKSIGKTAPQQSDDDEPSCSPNLSNRTNSRNIVTSSEKVISERYSNERILQPTIIDITSDSHALGDAAKSSTVISHANFSNTSAICEKPVILPLLGDHDKQALPITIDDVEAKKSVVMKEIDQTLLTGSLLGCKLVCPNGTILKSAAAETKALKGAIPVGIPKSGRFWKTQKQRFTGLVQNRTAHTTWEKKVAARMELKAMKALEMELKSNRNKALEAKRLRHEENQKRRIENERKSEVVQPIKNTAKLKRMKKKQLRQIEKRDFSKLKK